MAEEIDKATEARRKALRNGEEDPVIVAQRFLNIYRQRHIFSAERKEAFDKMLLELSPEIRGLFSGLPGGVMLQDYVDELAEKNGVAKAIHKDISAGGLTEEAHQQAQILAAALAQAQPQVQAAAPIQAAPQTVTGKVSMDKDFAGELARVMNSLMQQQTDLQQKSLEKLALDLSKTQMFIAKMMKESKSEQLGELERLSKVIAENQQTAKEEQHCELANLCQAIVESQKVSREEQRHELSELCKIIAQSQTALSASLGNISKETAVPVSSGSDSSTQKLIEVVLDGQRQINSRLDKVEEFSIQKADDNQQMLAAFEKSQAEIVKSLSMLKFDNLPISSGGSEERLAQIIGESQEKLVQALIAGNFQQNNVAQTSNNANNIQITAPDNSAQLLLLVDKIASLQASNEQNLEKAITRAIEEQGRLYDKTSRQQTKELAEIIAESLKEAARPVVCTMPAAGGGEYNKSEFKPEMINAAETEEVGHIPPQINDFKEFQFDMSFPQTNFATVENIDNNVYENNNDIEETVDAATEDIAENIDVAEEYSSELTFEEAPVAMEEPKKKRKRKKKKKKKTVEESLPQDENVFADEEEIVSDFIQPVLSEDAYIADDATAVEEMSFDDLPEDLVQESDLTEIFDETVATEPDELSAQIEETDDLPEIAEEHPSPKWDIDDFEVISESDGDDDWGFGSSEENITPEGSNDNQEGEDWEWEYVEDTEDDAGVEAIGGNSYIYSSDLYSQEKVLDDKGVIYGAQTVNMNGSPVIVDNAEDDEFIDPYQNSILKD